MRKKETPNPSRVRGRGVEVSETLFYCKEICGNDMINMWKSVDNY